MVWELLHGREMKSNLHLKTMYYRHYVFKRGWDQGREKEIERENTNLLNQITPSTFLWISILPHTNLCYLHHTYKMNGFKITFSLHAILCLKTQKILFAPLDTIIQLKILFPELSKSKWGLYITYWNPCAICEDILDSKSESWGVLSHNTLFSTGKHPHGEMKCLKIKVQYML